jgi:hypothetical protein
MPISWYGSVNPLWSALLLRLMTLATDSFYKNLNQIVRQCELSHYEPLSKGLDALLRQMTIGIRP